MATLELFELELLGGVTEQRYREMRPEVEDMPWGTLDPTNMSEEVVLAARKAWTGAAFQEFRTGAACAATLQALIEARAPVDLIALAARFPLDEMVHVELCSRIAGELGGAVQMAYDPQGMIGDIGVGCHPILKASHLVVAYFCVGEALSIPLLHGTWQATEHPLIKKVLRRIVLDEADHGTFGWTFLDWANAYLDDEERVELGKTADKFIGNIHHRWELLRNNEAYDIHQEHALGWMESDDYLVLAEKSLQRNVVNPLVARNIPVSIAK
jgi:hypothetical protein